MKFVQVGLILAVCIALVASISIENELSERKKGKGKKPGKKPVKPSLGGKGSGGKGNGSGGKGNGSGGKGIESLGDWLDVWEHFGELKNLLMALETSGSEELKEEGETCGSCFCPPTFNAGICKPGLTCVHHPLIADKPGTCTRCGGFCNGTCPEQCDCCGDVCCPSNWHCGCDGSVCWNPAWGLGPQCPQDVCKPQGGCSDDNSCEPNQQCCFHPGVWKGECYPDECSCPSCDSDSQCPADETCCPTKLLGGLNYCAVNCAEVTTSKPVGDKECHNGDETCSDPGGTCDTFGYCCPEGTLNQYCCFREHDLCNLFETSTANPGSGKGKPGKGKGAKGVKGGKGGKKAKGKGR